MRWLVLFSMSLLMACSNLPTAIKQAPSPDWQLTDVTAQLSQHLGQQIRWGGQVLSVSNAPTGAEIQIVQFPLNSYARPRPEQKSMGRFIVKTSEFVDPHVYKTNTLVTVAGTIVGQQTLTIDQKQIVVPIIELQELYRWVVDRYPDDQWPYSYDRFDYGFGYPAWRSHWWYDHRHYW